MPVDGMNLGHGIEAAIAEIGANQGVVLLLDEARVILAPRAVARESDLRVQTRPEAQQVGVEELGAVVGMDLADGEGQTVVKHLEGIVHDHAPAAQHGIAFAPAGGDIDHLQRVDVVSHSIWAAVMHQIDLQVAGFLFIPGDAPHGDGGKNLRFACRRSAGQATGQLGPVLLQQAIDGGSADLAQAGFHLWAQTQLAMPLQVTGGGQQGRLESLATDVVQALRDDQQGFLYLLAV